MAGETLIDDEPDINKTRSFEIARTYQEEKQRGKKKSRLEQLKEEVDTDDHRIPIEELYARLNTNPETGLTEEQHAIAFARDGPNQMTPPKTVPATVKFLLQLFGGFSALLWTGAFLCLIGYALDNSDQSNLYLGVVLVLVVVSTAVFSHFQDSKAAQVMDKFKNMIPQSALVLRNGEKAEMNAVNLVVGDIVEVKLGNKVPADIRIIECSNMKVDNSSITGESEFQSRSVECTDDDLKESKNVAFFTSSVVEGSGTGVVIATGDHTFIGHIAGLASGTASSETPIHREIHHFIKIISAIAITLGVIFFLFGLTTYPIITNVVFVIGIIVANVPEGLLATVTVSLTLTSKRMARKNVLVKNLESVETLGSTKTICSDKTGTLTQNKMTVAHVWVDGEIYETDTPTTSANYDPNTTGFKSLHKNVCLCSNAVFSKNDTDKPVIMRATRGDGSESAMIKFCQPLRDVNEMRAASHRVAEIPFNSTNKFHVTIVEPEEGGPLMCYMKGAPERVINKCSRILIKDTEHDLDGHWKDAFQHAYEELGGKGERVLGHCQLQLPAEYDANYDYNVDDPNFPLDGMTFLGLSALIDPPRAAVPEAVQTCTEAHIKVVMVTGDHPITAKAIAQQVGIIRDVPTADTLAEEQGKQPWDISSEDCKAVVIRGDQLRDMTDEQLDAIIKFEQIVFARTSPQQKLRIVEGFQRNGDIVAVTGDGVNDSPALKQADIGIAMGITGSEVSQEAADMILLDDNFASIVKGIEEGRLIFDNLKKSIAYTLSSNIPEIAPFILFILFKFPLPLTTVLILCVDLGTDLIPAISLAYEESEADIMKRWPRDAEKDKLVTMKLISFSYLQIGIIQAIAGFFTYFVVMGDFGYSPFELPGLAPYFAAFPEAGFEGPLKVGSGTYDHGQRLNALANAQTAYFCTIVLVQWADLVICKTRKLSVFQQGMRNMVLNFGLVSETILMIFLVYCPFLDIAIGTRPLHPRHFLPALPFTYFIICYDEARKWWIRTYPTGWINKFTYY